MLWLFGLLAGVSTVPRSVLRTDLLPEVEQAVEQFRTPPLALLGALFILLAALVGLAVTLLNGLGQAALTHQIYQIENGLTVRVKTGWAVGKRYAWRVFLIIILLSLPIFAVIALGSLPYLLLALRLRALSQVDLPTLIGAGLAGLVCLAPAVCLGAVLAIPLTVIRRLAVLTCVLDDQPVWPSVAQGWRIVRENLGAAAVLWLLLLAINAAIAVLAGGPLAGLVVALLLPRLLTVQASLLARLGVALGTAGLLWLVVTVIDGVAEAFRMAFWTLAYRQLTGLGRTGQEPTHG
jgi:hypothetical protein